MSEGGGPHSGTPGTSLAVDFHTYGLEWTPDYLNFYYDNIVVWRVNNTDPCPPGPPCVVAPVSHVPEIIQLASEVPEPGRETAYGPTPVGGFGENGDDSKNPKMTIEYVRHYQLFVPPSGLMATAVSLSQINLAWTDEHYPHPEDGFRIERSTDGVNFTQIATVAAGAQSYPDMGLNANTQYHYRVRAYKGATNTDPSNTASAVTEVTPPAAVTNLSVPIKVKTKVAVAWSAPGDDGTGQAVVEYDLRSSTSPITGTNFGSATRVTTSAPHMSGYPECQIITGLTSCTTYYFAIKSKDDSGLWSGISNVPNVVTACNGSNNISSCPTPPSDNIRPAAVTNLSVPGSGTTTLAVSWTAPGDDGTTGIAREYDFRYSVVPIDASNFTSATRLQIPTPQPAGSPECFLVTGLATCAGYYFALKTRDEMEIWSEISNVQNGTTYCQQGRFAECSSGNPAAKMAVQNDEAPRLFSAPSPNPARGNMSFRISVPSESRGAKLRVRVFDTAGRQVRSLVDRVASPGPADVEWNLRDDSGRRVASGLYMMRVEVADRRETFRLVVVR